MGNNRITWNVGFNVDKSQLKEVNKELKALQNLTMGQLLEFKPHLNLEEAKQELAFIKSDATKLEQAFSKAFNPQLGTVNLKTLNAELDSLTDNLPKINARLSSVGTVGTQAFQRMASAIMGTKLQLKESNKFLDDMSKTMGNTIKWGITSRIFNGITESVQNAWDYTKRLDASLNDIRIVTGKSADEMERFARTANKAAQTLGKSTKDFTDASLIYYQQGLTDKEVETRTNVTLKTASVTGQATDTVSEQLTAVWNGYQVAVEDSEKYIDKLAKVAATTASDLEELSVGMSKVAAAANIMGVDVDQLSATLSTVISVTRQAPETVGTAFKTIFARMGDIEAGLDGEVSLDKYTQDMLDVGGINVLDSNNKLRDMGEVIEEVGNKWSTMSREQQIALSQVMAGTRQYNNLLSLFDNWDMYEKAVETSKGSLGYLNEQQEIYMERTSAHLHQLEAAWERVFDSLVDNKSVNGLIDILTNLTNAFASLTEATGGGWKSLLMFGTIASRVLSKNMAQGVVTFVRNQSADKNNEGKIQGKIDSLEKLNKGSDDAGIQARIDGLKYLKDNLKNLNVEQIETFTEMIDNVGEATSKMDMLNEKIDQAQKFLRKLQNTSKAKIEPGAVVDYLNNEAQDSDAVAFEDALSKQEDTIKFRKGQLRSLDAREREYISRNNSTHFSGMENLFKDYQSMYDSSSEIVTGTAFQGKLKENQKDINIAKKAVIEEYKKADIEAYINKEIEKAIKAAQKDAKTNNRKFTKENREEVENITRARAEQEANDKKIHLRKISTKGKSLDQIYNQLDDEYKQKFEQYILGLLRNGKSIIEDALNENSRQIENVKEIKKEGGTEYLEDKAEIDLNNAKEDLDNKWKDIDTTEAVQSVMNLFNGFGMLTSAVLTFINIGEIFKNEDLTTGEKILQIILAIASALPMLAKGIQDISSGTSTLVKEFPKVLEKLKGMVIARQKQMQAAENAKVAEMALAGATTKGAAATTAASGATVTFGSAVASLVAPFAIAAVAIAAVVAIVYGLVKAYNADADAAKEAAETAETLTNRYNELKQSVQEFKDSISEYNDGIKALEELDKYTEEYKNTLEETNDKAKELIETFGLWNNYEIKNGVITIDPDALKKKEREKENQLSKAESASYSATMVSNEAELKLLRTETSRKIGALSKSQYMNQGPGGSVRYVEGTTYETKERQTESNQLNDYSMNLLAEAFTELKNTDELKFNELMAEGNEGKLKETLLAMEELTPAIKANIDQIIRQKDALKLLADQTEQNVGKNAYLTNQIMQNEIEGKYGSQLEKLAKDENGEVNQARYQQLLAITAQDKNKQNELQNKLEGIDLSNKDKWNSNNKLKNYGYTIDNDEDLARTYAKEILNYTEDEINKMDYDGHAGAGTLKLTNGDKILDKYSDEQMREQLARKNQTDKITTEYSSGTNKEKQIGALNELIAGSVKLGNKYGADFTDALLNSLTDKEHKIDLSGLFADIDPNEYNEIMNMSDEDIIKMVGMTDEKLKEAGYASAKEFATNFKAGLNGYKWDVDKALDSAIGKRDDDYEEMDLETEDVKDYAKHLMEMSKSSEELSDELATNADASALVSEYIIRMNKGIKNLAEGFEDWEDVLKKSSKESEEYSDALTGIQDSLGDIIGVESEFISNDYVTEHLEDIKKAAEGDEQAIDRLKEALAEDIVLKVMAEGEIDVGKQQEVLSLVEKLQQQIPTIKVGTEINMDDESNKEFFNTMQDIVTKAGMTAEQANALFSTMGFETEFVTEQKPVKKTGHGTRTVMEFKGSEKVTMPDGSTMEIPSGWETKTYPGEAYEYVDYVDAIAMETSADGKTKTPKIKSITRKGTSSMNNYSSSNKGGGSPKKGGSKKEPNKMDKLDKTPDRYHKVNTQLSKIGNQLSKIQSQEKKLTGKDLIANINSQLGQLNNRLDQLREKMKIAQGETAELRNSLAGQGVQFNADGTIANYMDIYQAKVDYVNSLIEKYNAMSAEEQEKYKDTVEQAKQDLDKFTEDLNRYDELISDFMPGLEQEIQDAIDEQIELNIKKFNIEFEVRLDMEEAEKEWNEFKKKIIDGIKDDDIYGNAKARATDDLSVYLRENGGALDNSTKRTNEILAELREMDATGWSDVYGDNRAQALEDLKEAYSAVMEDLMEIDEIQKDVHQAWLDTMDDINDKMADQVAMYEQISNIIEHDMKVIQLVYGEQDYEALGKYYDKQHQNNLGLLEAQRMNADFWEKEMNSIDKEKDPDAWKKARDNWISAVNDLNATIEASIENARAKMENAIDETFDKFNDEITNGKGLDYLQQQWDLVNDNADDYLDTVNAAFGIRQLENKYQDAIDMTDNVSAQRKLNQLMQDELKALREKDKLTEYDIERANMKYEIAMKQLALEEAQQTKTTMRLRRDSQGNYRYEYVADEDAIGKLQEELDQLENSLYNFDKDRWLEMQNQVVDAVRERQEAIKEILMDASLSEEERAERLAEINALYNEKIQNITDQTVTAQENLYQSGADEIAKIWDEQGKDFQALSNEEQRILVEEMLPQFDTGVNQMIEKFSGEGGFEEQTTGSMEELSKATQDYKTDLEDIETASGTSFDAIEDGLDKNIPKTQQLVQDNQDLNDEYIDQIENIKELNRQLDIQIAKYKALTTASNEAAQAGHNYYMQQKQQEADAAAEEKAGNNTNSGNSNNQGDTSGSAGGTSGSGNGVPEVGDIVTYTGGRYYKNAWGGQGYGERGPNKQVRITDIKEGTPFPYHVYSTDSAYGWLKEEQLTGFESGGYTGDWVGNYGKLALLHNKELVLNENDTKNMLSMMEIARSIVANAGPGIRAFNAGRIGNSAPDQLEQNVHIEANFPNVESASQIEEALNNLVQLASQRASRNRRG